MPQLSPADRRLLERCTTVRERIAFLTLYERDPLHWQPRHPLRLAPTLKPTTAQLITLFCAYHADPLPHRVILEHNLTTALSRLVLSGYVMQTLNGQTQAYYQLTYLGTKWIESAYATS